MSELRLKGKQAQEASYFLGNVTSEQKQQALYKMAVRFIESARHDFKSK